MPDMDIVSLRVVHKEPSLFLQDSKLRAEGGEITVTGEVTEKEKVDLQFKVAGVNVTPLLPEDWRARLHGRVAGDGRLQISLRDGPRVPPGRPAPRGSSNAWHSRSSRSSFFSASIR